MQPLHIRPTTIMACVKYVLFRHCTSKVNYHVIISFGTVVEYIQMFRRVDLTFEHYVSTTKVLISNYLLVPKMFLGAVKFGSPPH